MHRKDCPNLAYISDITERSIHVEWETVSPKAVKHFRVLARKTLDLFSEIEGAIRKYGGHLIAGKIEEDGYDRLLANFSMELERGEDVKAILKNLRTLPSILNLTEAAEEEAH
ncbi:MAG: hypothetical protein HC888_17075 [Candidatus Competibacteraceae bacterium]|nr:hypothetical protein [Candidatus Competibacteraceae bacterium]